MQSNETISIAIDIEKLVGNKPFKAKDNKMYVCIESQNMKVEEYNGVTSYKIWIDVNQKKDTPDKAVAKIGYNKLFPEQKIYIGNGSIRTFGAASQQAASAQQPATTTHPEPFEVKESDGDGLPF